MNDRSDPCGTCQKLFANCPGHMGYIELPMPVVNPLFHKLIGNILRMTCLKCFSIQTSGKFNSESIISQTSSSTVYINVTKKIIIAIHQFIFSTH